LAMFIGVIYLILHAIGYCALFKEIYARGGFATFFFSTWLLIILDFTAAVYVFRSLSFSLHPTPDKIKPTTLFVYTLNIIYALMFWCLLLSPFLEEYIDTSLPIMTFGFYNRVPLLGIVDFITLEAINISMLLQTTLVEQKMQTMILSGRIATRRFSTSSRA